MKYPVDTEEYGQLKPVDLPVKRLRVTINVEAYCTMTNFFKGMITNMGVAGELLFFLWQRRLWWLIPMVFVLLLFGLLLIFATSSGVAPFIYTLF